MTTLAWVLLVTAAGSAAAVVLSGSLLLLPERARRALLPQLLAYATGTLLAASLLALLPEALEAQGTRPTLGILLAGILLFFLFERLLLWRHCHEPECRRHRARAPLILVGDGLHNFADGAVIAASFLTSVPLGIAMAVAVFSHEIPQEVGDFAILLSAGVSRRDALLGNLLSAASALAGAGAGYGLLARVGSLVPVVVTLSAASFLYMALADLVPALHHETEHRRSLLQLAALLAGVASILLLSGGGGHGPGAP